jgi:hypothetical protein
MKKNTLKQTLVLIFAFCSLKTFAQTIDFSINLAPMVFTNFSGNLSYNLEDNMSVGTVIGYQNLKITATSGTTTEEVGYGGFYIAPEFRYFFNPDRGNDGFFAGPYLKFRSMGSSGEAYAALDANGDVVNYDTKNTGLALGIVLGKTWITNSNIFFTTWTGLGYYLFNKTTNSKDFEKDPLTTEITSSVPTLDFRLGLSVGYRFGN